MNIPYLKLISWIWMMLSQRDYRVTSFYFLKHQRNCNSINTWLTRWDVSFGRVYLRQRQMHSIAMGVRRRWRLRWWQRWSQVSGTDLPATDTLLLRKRTLHISLVEVWWYWRLSWWKRWSGGYSSLIYLSFLNFQAVVLQIARVWR